MVHLRTVLWMTGELNLAEVGKGPRQRSVTEHAESRRERLVADLLACLQADVRFGFSKGEPFPPASKSLTGGWVPAAPHPIAQCPSL